MIADLIYLMGRLPDNTTVWEDHNHSQMDKNYKKHSPVGS